MGKDAGRMRNLSCFNYVRSFYRVPGNRRRDLDAGDMRRGAPVFLGFTESERLEQRRGHRLVPGLLREKEMLTPRHCNCPSESWGIGKRRHRKVS